MSDKESSPKAINYWREVEGGFRGSLMLRLGAVTAATGGLIDLGAQILSGADGPPDDVTRIAWLLFILGLWFLATGFLWAGSQSMMTRFSFVVGVLHAAQGIHLLILLFTHTTTAIPPISLTIGRLLATLIFAFLEREWLDTRTRNLLIGATSLLLLKAVGRILGYLSELGSPLEPLLDTVLLLGLATALFQLAMIVHDEENQWARTLYEDGHSDFADFNNPEHSWNKGKSGTVKPRR